MPSKFKARTIVFTIFDETAVRDPEAWLKDLSLNCQWCLGQLEKCEETGKLHVQGMAFSKENCAWPALTKLNAHKEKCKSPLDSIKYCSKEDTRVAGPWEFGERPSWNIKGQKVTNAELLKRPLTELVEEERIPLKGLKKLKEDIDTYRLLKKADIDREAIAEDNLWIVGKPGVGKSFWVRSEYGTSLYLKAQNKWWDGYNGQETVLIDDFDKQGACLSHHLKLWADCYALNGEVKGSTIPLTYKRLIITSNYRPDEIWTDDAALLDAISRRFRIREMLDRSPQFINLN